MSLLFETIRVEGGVLLHAAYHNARLNRSRSLLLGRDDRFDLRREVNVPAGLGGGVYRCRVEYTGSIEHVIFTPYTPRAVRSLQLVEADAIGYDHKFTDRSAFGKLRGGTRADDILIVRNGLVTDTSYANIALFDGTRWVTPAAPLLPGTARARLLDEGVLTAGTVRRENLRRYQKVVLINAMLGFDPKRALDVEGIIS